jgi:hypothetical protein
MDWRILKKFKNQLHLVRSAADAMSQKDINFNISAAINKAVEFNLRLPPDTELALFATVLRPLADPSSPTYYKNISTLLHENNFLSASDRAQFDSYVQQCESGPIQLKLNEKSLTAVALYELYSKGEFFGEQETEVNKIKELRAKPFVSQYMLYSFHSYCFDVYRACKYLYRTIRDAEATLSPSETSGDEPHQCIYCLTTTGNFQYEEHVYPESLGNTEIVLPAGYVCDECNNGVLSDLDKHLVEQDAISFLRVIYLPYNTKTGKFPKARYQNMTIEKTRPRGILIKEADGSKRGFKVDSKQSDKVRGTLSVTGRQKFDPVMLGRSLYKIALGIVCWTNGSEFVLQEKYAAARAFVLGKRGFPNSLLIQGNCTPSPNVEGQHFITNPGTLFVIRIFGLPFIFNLEPQPVVQMNAELEKMGMQCFSLSGIHTKTKPEVI